jgi:hypothetical protein
MAGSIDPAGVGNSLMEDVTDIILNIDPTETPLMSSLKSKKSKAVTHEWLTDSYASATNTPRKEGVLWSTDAISGRTRKANVCQISHRVYEVTGTMQAVSQYGINKELAYQAAKKMVELKRDVNLILWQGDSANPSDTADFTGARQTLGFHQMGDDESSAYTGDARYTIAAMTGAAAEDSFNAVLQDIYNNGPKASIAFMLPKVKRKVSRWTGVATKYFEQAAKKITNVVNFYESDFGVIRFVMDRNMEDPATENNHLLFAGDFSNSATAYLRPWQTKRIDVPKDAEAGVVLTEYCLEYGHAGSYGYMKAST